MKKKIKPLNIEEKLKDKNTFIKYLNKTYIKNYDYIKYIITIDEYMVPFKERIIFFQYCHNKRNKFGIKFFEN